MVMQTKKDPQTQGFIKANITTRFAQEQLRIDSQTNPPRDKHKLTSASSDRKYKLTNQKQAWPTRELRHLDAPSSLAGNTYQGRL